MDTYRACGIRCYERDELGQRRATEPASTLGTSQALSWRELRDLHLPTATLYTSPCYCLPAISTLCASATVYQINPCAARRPLSLIARALARLHNRAHRLWNRGGSQESPWGRSRVFTGFFLLVPDVEVIPAATRLRF